MSDGYEVFLPDQMFVVVRRDDETVFGPFESELSAVRWARTILRPHRGYFIRPVNPPKKRKFV